MSRQGILAGLVIPFILLAAAPSIAQTVSITRDPAGDIYFGDSVNFNAVVTPNPLPGGVFVDTYEWKFVNEDTSVEGS